MSTYSLRWKYVSDYINRLLRERVIKNITTEEKANYDAAYVHSQSAHAPSEAEQNVQADWNESSAEADSFVLNKPIIPTAFADLTDDSTHRIVTDAEKTSWNGKIGSSNSTIANIIKLTQAEYDALSPNYSSSTLYVVID